MSGAHNIEANAQLVITCMVSLRTAVGSILAGPFGTRYRQEKGYVAVAIVSMIRSSVQAATRHLPGLIHGLLLGQHSTDRPYATDRILDPRRTTVLLQRFHVQQILTAYIRQLFLGSILVRLELRSSCLKDLERLNLYNSRCCVESRRGETREHAAAGIQSYSHTFSRLDTLGNDWITAWLCCSSYDSVVVWCAQPQSSNTVV